MKIKNTFLNTLLLLFVLTIDCIYSQTKAVSDAAFAEKIYTQVTSTVVTTDDALWFKCLVTDANQVPTTLSKILHVELIDFDKRILETKLYKIEEGVVSGSIDLNENMVSGRYQLRAYTEWNQNFGVDFISKVYVDIYQPKEIKTADLAIREVVLKEMGEGELELSAKAYPRLLNSKHKGKLELYIHTENQTDTIEVKKGENYEYSFQYTLPKNAVTARVEMQVDSIKLRNYNKGYVPSYSKTIVVNKDFLDVQFFAEGGKLISGLQNKLGFKVLDCQNKGIEIQGNVVNDSDEIITTFSSNTLGMGVVDLTPKQAERYHAEIKGNDGVVYKYPLPTSEKKGVVFHVQETATKIELTAHSNQELEKDVLVKIQSHGMSQGIFFMDFENNKAKKELEKKHYPEGILKFNVYNLKGQIISERLFFNYKEEERINLQVESNKPKYQQREKTKVSIVTKDKKGNPITSNLSVLVINKELLGESYKAQNSILSYFLLNSELKGTIENPGFYFDENNPKRKQAMDALLLTQGWKNYTYELPLETEALEFKPETCLTVSGSVKDLWTKEAPKSPTELTLLYEPLQVQTKLTKTNGKFKFNIKDQFKEKFKIAIQSKNKKGKKKEIKVELDAYQSPKVDYKKEEKVYLPDSIYQEVIAQNIKVKEAEEAYSLVNGVEQLDEVELTGYTMTPTKQKMMDEYGFPDLVVENEELLIKSENWEYGLFRLIEYLYPNDFNTSDRKTIFLFIDGSLIEDTFIIPEIPIEEVKSFELIKRPKRPIIGIHSDTIIQPYDSKIISIYTYNKKKGLSYINKNVGFRKKIIQGFTPQSTEFYIPKYDNKVVNNWNIPDLRSVVYWNPIIKTDENGEAELDFYNGDNTGEILFVVEGITKDGKLGYSTFTYEVNEKLKQ